jgi:hypothetical protein
MLRQTRHQLRRVSSKRARAWVAHVRLQLILWTLWTLAVTGTAYLNWHADRIARRPVNLIGLIVHCVLVGVIGLIVITKIEMWLQPWKFMS